MDEDQWHYSVDIRNGFVGVRCARELGSRSADPPDTLRGWVQRAEVNEGARPGTTTDEQARLVALEREVRELRRANTV